MKRRLAKSLMAAMCLVGHIAACSDDNTDGVANDMAASDMIQSDTRPEMGEVEDMTNTGITDMSPLDMGILPDDSVNDVCGKEGDILSPQRLPELQGCKVYAGTIDLANFTGENLDELSGLEEIRGGLNLFRATNIKDLAGLSALRSIEGQLTVRLCRSIKDLSGLEQATEIGSIRISNNESLAQLTGLDSLEETGGLQLTFNAALQSLDGLTNLSKIDGDLEIRSNASLPQPQVDAFVQRVDVTGETTIGF